MTPKLGSYNQVLALTQQMLNAGLQALYNKSDLAQQVVPRVGNRQIWLKNFVFDVPEIVIPHIDIGATRSKVIFIISIKSGSIKYYTSEDQPIDNPSSVNAAGVTFGLPTDLEIADVLDEQKVKELRQELNVGTDYSIGRLLVSISKVAGSNPDNRFTKIPSEVPSGDLASLVAFLCSKGGILDKELTTLGYVTKPSDSKTKDPSYSPTFQPNATRMQVSSWYDSQGAPAGTGKSGNAVLNYLLYLQTTGTNTPPEGRDMLIETKENWTPGAAYQSDNPNLVLGRFYVSRKDFFETWLIPKLWKVNKAMHISACDLYVGAYSNSHYKWDARVTMRGEALKRDKSKSDDGPSSWNFIPQGNRWRFQHDYDYPRRIDQVGWTIACCGAISSRNWTVCEYKENSNRIVIRGETQLWIVAEVWRGKADSSGTSAGVDRIGRSLDWAINLDLESVKDGGIQIRITKGYCNWKHERDDYGLKLLGGFLDPLDGQGPEMTQNLLTLAGELSTELNAVNRLYLPARGLFYYTDPSITEHGDVTANVRYTRTGSSFPGSDRMQPGVDIDMTPTTVGGQFGDQMIPGHI